MNERINDWLDGRIPFEALTASERASAREVERLLGLAAEAEAERAGAVPDLSGSVLAALAARSPERARRPGPARILRAIWPQSLGLRPAAAVAAICLALGFGLGLWTARGPAGGSAVTEAGSAIPTVFVRFELVAPQARTVRLAGSFTGWEPRYQLNAAGDDLWTITLPLEAGVHDYVFVVDGDRHVLDPNAPRIADGFGGFNNRIALLPSAL